MSDIETKAGKLIIKDGVNWEEVDPKLRSSINKFVERGVSIRITSGKDSTHKSTSHHYKGQAIDITPIDRKSYGDLLTQFRQHPDILKELKESGYRIYDERTKKGKEWSGAHFHIGKDSRVPLDNWENLPLNVKLVQDNVNKISQPLVKKGLQGKGYTEPMARVLSEGVTQDVGVNIPSTYLESTQQYWNSVKTGEVTSQNAEVIDEYNRRALGHNYEYAKTISDPNAAYDIYSSTYLQGQNSKEINSDVYLNSIKQEFEENSLPDTSDVYEKERDIRLQLLKERQEERNFMMQLANNAVVEAV